MIAVGSSLVHFLGDNPQPQFQSVDHLVDEQQLLLTPQTAQDVTRSNKVNVFASVPSQPSFADPNSNNVGPSMFQPSYAALFLTQQSRAALLAQIPEPSFRDVVLDHVTVQHLRRSSRHSDFGRIPVPGAPAVVEVYGILRGKSIECLLVRGQLFGRPLDKAVYSGLPHITFSKRSTSSSFESVQLLKDDRDKIRKGSSTADDDATLRAFCSTKRRCCFLFTVRCKISRRTFPDSRSSDLRRRRPGAIHKADILVCSAIQH